MVKSQHNLKLATLSGITIIIIVDTYTGVNYMLTGASVSPCLTPLLDENGEIVTDAPVNSFD